MDGVDKFTISCAFRQDMNADPASDKPFSLMDRSLATTPRMVLERELNDERFFASIEARLAFTGQTPDEYAKSIIRDWSVQDGIGFAPVS